MHPFHGQPPIIVILILITGENCISTYPDEDCIISKLKTDLAIIRHMSIFNLEFLNMPFQFFSKLYTFFHDCPLQFNATHHSPSLTDRIVSEIFPSL